MRTRLFKSDHPIARQELVGRARRFFKDVLPAGASDRVVLALEGPNVVGWLRFNWDARKDTLYAVGTWVEPEWRKGRVAQALWQRAVRDYRPGRIVVTTVTRNGRRLVSSMVRRFPNITFEVKAAA